MRQVGEQQPANPAPAKNRAVREALWRLRRNQWQEDTSDDVVQAAWSHHFSTLSALSVFHLLGAPTFSISNQVLPG